jgi:ribulose-phosphate 3-epimerase
MTIYPAILSDQRSVVQQQLDLAVDDGDVETVQIDIIDGRFSDNITISPADLPDFTWGDLQCDLHLMTEEPLDFVYELLDVKDVVPVRAVIAQVERMSSQSHFLEEVQKHDWLPGLSLDIFTPFDAVDASSLPFLKVLQLMGIEAGSQGQELKPQVFEKISQIAVPCRSLGIELLVDGGVNAATIRQLAKAGVTGVAVGSALWNSADFSGTMEQLRAHCA